MSLKVLLADDSVPAQNMGKKILVDAGYDVLTASNGLEALRKITETPPDIAILDIFMPGYSGLELCARLRGETPTAALPVILTVGKLEPYRAEDGEQVQSNAVIIKPFAAAELISAVRSLIGEPPPEPPPVEPLAELPPMEDPFADFTYSGDVPLPLMESPAAAGAVDPLDEAEPSFYRDSDDPRFAGFHSGGESAGPESLRFNPDAARTPFSASVVDFMPALSNLPAQEESFASGEIDLPAAPSPHPSESVDEPLFAAPEADGQNAQDHVEVQGEAPQLIPAQEAATTADAFPAAQLTPDEEEARRLAFEELFNSTDPAPLDEMPAAPAETPLAEAAPAPAQSSAAESSFLPSMANLSYDRPSDIEMDSEIEPLTRDSQASFIAPEPDPCLLEELEPMNVVTEIPGDDALPNDGGEPNPLAIESMQEPVEAVASDVSPSHTPPELDCTPAEAEPLAIEPLAAPEVAEAMPEPEPEPVPELALPEALPEVAPAAPEVEAHTVEAPVAEVAELAAVPAVIAAAEQMVTEVAKPAAEFAPAHLEPEAAEVQELETIPLPVQVAAEPEAQIAVEPAPEPLQASAPLEPIAEAAHSAMEAQAVKVASSPELDHAYDEERVRQAVDRVFDRFKRLLVNAVVRELNRRD